jgi:hypothetical protein
MSTHWDDEKEPAEDLREIVDEAFLQRPDGHQAVPNRAAEQEQQQDKLPPRAERKVE